MGSYKPKKNMNIKEKAIYLRQQASKYGISERDYQDDEGNHKDRLGSFTGSNIQESVIKAMNNDYDLRDSLKYGIDSGNKHFDGLDNRITDINSAADAHRAVVKYGDKVLNHKKTDSASDFANISNALFNDSRSKFGESFAPVKDEQAETEDTSKSPLQDSTDPIEYEHSPKVKAAQEQLDNYKLNIGKTNLFGSVDQEPPASDDQAEATNLFANKYKTDVSSAANLKENKSRNINNAIDTVQNSYRHKFMSN